MKSILLVFAFSAFLRLAHAETDSQALAEELGSLRNATVAVKIADPKQEITYFTDSTSEK